ncbi:MAG: 8-oxoguanine DNA glycosylase [Tissierellia bacterium]|nr:8-oxoguanine DNA glycosylase [Tissierellia bacterium]
MNYLISDIENGIKVSGLRDFCPEHIFECGQAFRWERTEEGSYIAVAKDKVAEFLMKDGELYVFNATKEDFEEVWHDYFNLDTDYQEIKDNLKKTLAYSKNDSLKEAIEFGNGLRILNQDHFEMIISFIISANNQIPRIKKSVELLSQTYGDFIGVYKGKKYHRFPSPAQLAYQDPEEVKEITRVGFRHTRIVEAARSYLEENDKFENVSLEELKNNLIALPGVGPKVMDCILLFGYGIEDTFPVDVWVKRLMETLYLDQPIPNKKILEEAGILFGDYKGHAQQYLFYYARENAIGK